MGAQFVGGGSHKKVLVIGSDVMTSILNYEDRATCVLFGDGAGAVLIEPAEDGEGILDFEHDVDGAGGCNLYMPGGGSLNPSSHETVDKKIHYVHQEGQQVFKYAVRRMSELAAEILERNGLKGDDLALVVPHQANLRIIKAMQERIGVPDSKVMINIERYGNTTAGTLPLGMMQALDEKRIADVAVAVPPVVPVVPQYGPFLVIKIGLLISLMLSVIAAFAADYLDPSFRTPKEVMDALNIPVLASMPRKAA